MSIQFDYQRVNSRESIDQAKAPDHHSGANSVRTSGYFGHGSPSKPMVGRPEPPFKGDFRGGKTAGPGDQTYVFNKREPGRGLPAKSRGEARGAWGVGQCFRELLW